MTFDTKMWYYAEYDISLRDQTYHIKGGNIMQPISKN